MKSIIYFLIFLVLSSIAVIAADSNAPFPYPMYGIITLEGDRVDSMQVNIEYVDKGEVITKYTYGGEILMDASEFDNYLSPGKSVKITYCVSDSRCDAVSQTFTIGGGHLDFSRDLPYSYHDLSGPYPVYGHVYKNGNPQADIKILVENVNQDKSEKVTTNEAGEYSVNIGNWGKRNIGDLIKISYESYVSYGYVTNKGHIELNLDITPIIPPDNEDDDLPPQEDDIQTTTTIPVEPDETTTTILTEPDTTTTILVEPEEEPKSKIGIIIVCAIVFGGLIIYFILKKKRDGG
jgi:hypothetical protein